MLWSRAAAADPARAGSGLSPGAQPVPGQIPDPTRQNDLVRRVGGESASRIDDQQLSARAVADGCADLIHLAGPEQPDLRRGEGGAEDWFAELGRDALTEVHALTAAGRAGADHGGTPGVQYRGGGSGSRLMPGAVAHLQSDSTWSVRPAAQGEAPAANDRLPRCVRLAVVAESHLRHTARRHRVVNGDGQGHGA